MPKRDYYCQSRRGNRLFELGLSDVALALCAASSKTDQAAIARVTAEHGTDGSSTPGCAIAASAGPPISFPTSPTRRSPMKLCRTRAARLAAALLIAPVAVAPMLAAPAHANGSCSIRPTMRRTC
jgi:hypothetical protein